MKLVVGGYAQGKLAHVRSKYPLQEELIWEGKIPDSGMLHHMDTNKVMVVNHFHQWVRKRMADGGCPEDEIAGFIKDCQEQCVECIIISDEVGNGIVPIDAFEREYRERLGRILIQLADGAGEVERVICGIGQKIK